MQRQDQELIPLVDQAVLCTTGLIGLLCDLTEKMRQPFFEWVSQPFYYFSYGEQRSEITCVYVKIETKIL